MNIIMNACILVMSLFLTVAMLGCTVQGDPAETEPTINVVIAEPITLVINDPIVTDPGESTVVNPGESTVVEELPVHKVIDGILGRGNRVKVTNTIVNGVDKRLPIKNPAGIESPTIGSAADGAIGTILNGPVLDDGWTWWEIAWNDNGKVAFNQGENCCIGWSIETNFDQNVRYLTEVR